MAARLAHGIRGGGGGGASPPRHHAALLHRRATRHRAGSELFEVCGASGSRRAVFGPLVETGSRPLAVAGGAHPGEHRITKSRGHREIRRPWVAAGLCGGNVPGVDQWQRRGVPGARKGRRGVHASGWPVNGHPRNYSRRIAKSWWCGKTRRWHSRLRANGQIRNGRGAWTNDSSFGPARLTGFGGKLETDRGLMQ